MSRLDRDTAGVVRSAARSRILGRLGGTGGVALACAMLAVGLILTVVAAGALADAQRREADERMDRHLEVVRTVLAGETYRRVELLGHLSAAVGTQTNLTAQDFEALTFRLSYRGLAGVSEVGFVVSADDAHVQAVQRAWRGRGVSDLTVRPVRADEHRFVVLTRSLDGLSTALGLDLAAASEPTGAMDTARRTGQVAASQAYVLLRDRMLPTSRQQISFILAAPVYAAGGTADAGLLRGWLLMGVRGSDFINNTLQPASQGVLNVTLTDVSVPGQERRIADVHAGAPLADARLHRETTLDAAGRRWKLEIQPTDRFASTGDDRLHLVVLGCGALASLLLAGLVLVLVTSRDRALARVEQATAALQADIEQRQEVEIRLRERERELEGFAAVAAHDLKSPLTVIMGYCELVEDRLADRSDQQVNTWLSRVRTGTRRMQHLIDDLLNYAAAGNGSLELAEVDLNKLVGDIVTERTSHLEHDRPHIESGRLPVVVADPDRLRQVLDNLIGNAIKYVRHGTAAQIDINAEQDGPMWRISVADHGIGISPDQRDAVFGAFNRARGSEGYPGTGLGLAICRRIVNHHGGEIRAEDNTGGGSRFVFTLPVAPDPAGQDPAVPGGENPALSASK
ncbi:CHASE domain-containing protein [Planomonospora sp. ID67723]|uniref:sensor histidine kinase n=1 Tax=Planomonospora sp. ID67723 TaxID=2738134 RepID=UPI0018C44DC8|nr:ATP-binding protein [Planomonospora sp. ID67723]MBG0833270.1 CHASE domain-containing protein [Planomonospora sp. ID67723]